MTNPDPGLRRLAAGVLLPGFVGTQAPDWVLDLLDAGLAGVCLFAHNITDAVATRALTTALHQGRAGVLVASDEEGGSVTRLDSAGGSPWPGHGTLGALDDVDRTRRVAAGLGSRARSLGVDVVLAPVADVASEPDNPVIGERSFGADPALVSRHVSAYVAGLHEGGVAACVKHFPGHGATRSDSHLTLPSVAADEPTWRARDLPPFAAAIAAGVDCVMTAHVLVPALDSQPATISARVLGLLRSELGFTGAVLSDAVDMKALSDRWGRAGAAVAALRAGVDLVCVGNPRFPEPYDDRAAVDDLLDHIAAGVPGARLEQAAARVSTLAAGLPLATLSPPSPDEALAIGVNAVTDALTRSGDTRLGPEALVLLAAGESGYAAGRRPTILGTEIAGVVAVATPAHARVLLAGHRGPVAIAVEGRSSANSRDLLGAVLAERGDAVVIYLGPADPHQPPAAHQIVTHAGGRAAAVAVRRALAEEP